MSALLLTFRRLRRHSLTPGFRLVVLALAVSLAVLSQGAVSFLVLAVVAAYSLAVKDGGLAIVRRWQFWLLLIGLTMLSPLAIGEPDMNLWGVALSSEGLHTGVYMLARALSIAVAVSGFSNSVSVNELTGLFERAGAGGLGFAVGVAFNMLPTITTETQNVFDTLRLRGGFRRPLHGLRTLLIVALSNALRHADDIVWAAEARAFRAGDDRS